MGLEPTTAGLEGQRSAIELRPRRKYYGGQGRIRTSEGKRQQIYSLSPLTTREPARQ